MTTITISNTKGGTGKTTTALNLATELSNLDKKVLLIDGNFSAPNLGLHLDIINPEVTLHHVLSRKANIGDAIYKLEKFDVVPSSIFHRIRINPLMLKDKISHLKRKYDVILVDSSPALNEETLAVMLASDELFIVTTPDYPTLSTTLKALKLAKQRGTKINGLILNKVYNKDFELSLEDIEKAAEIPVMAVIPHDINVLKALSEFTPSTNYKPKSEASIEYKKLAAILIGEKYKPLRLRKLFGWINPRKQEINRTIFYKQIFE